MKTRKLKNGDKVKELDKSTTLEIRTRCPNKWKLIDMETGEEYVGTNPDEHHMLWKKVIK